MFLGLELIVALIVLAFLGGMLFKWAKPKEGSNEQRPEVRGVRPAADTKPSSTKTEERSG